MASVHEAWPLEVGCVVRAHYRHGLSGVSLVVLRRIEGGGRADQIESLLAVFSELAMHCNMLGFLVILRKFEESSRIIFLFDVSIVIEHLRQILLDVLAKFGRVLVFVHVQLSCCLLQIVGDRSLSAHG